MAGSGKPTVAQVAADILSAVESSTSLCRAQANVAADARCASQVGIGRSNCKTASLRDETIKLCWKTITEQAGIHAKALCMATSFAGCAESTKKQILDLIDPRGIAHVTMAQEAAKLAAAKAAAAAAAAPTVTREQAAAAAATASVQTQVTAEQALLLPVTEVPVGARRHKYGAIYWALGVFALGGMALGGMALLGRRKRK